MLLTASLTITVSSSTISFKQYAAHSGAIGLPRRQIEGSLPPPRPLRLMLRGHDTASRFNPCPICGAQPPLDLLGQGRHGLRRVGLNGQIHRESPDRDIPFERINVHVDNSAFRRWLALRWDPWNVVVDNQNAVRLLQVARGRESEMKRVTRREIDSVTRLHHRGRERLGESNQRGHGLGIAARIGHKNQRFVGLDQPLRRPGEALRISRRRRRSPACAWGRGSEPPSSA